MQALGVNHRGSAVKTRFKVVLLFLVPVLGCAPHQGKQSINTSSELTDGISIVRCEAIHSPSGQILRVWLGTASTDGWLVNMYSISKFIVLAQFRHADGQCYRMIDLRSYNPGSRPAVSEQLLVSSGSESYYDMQLPSDSRWYRCDTNDAVLLNSSSIHSIVLDGGITVCKNGTVDTRYAWNVDLYFEGDLQRPPTSSE